MQIAYFLSRNKLLDIIHKMCVQVLDQCTQFIAPIKRTVLNIYEYSKRSSDVSLAIGLQPGVLCFLEMVNLCGKMSVILI